LSKMGYGMVTKPVISLVFLLYIPRSSSILHHQASLVTKKRIRVEKRNKGDKKENKD